MVKELKNEKVKGGPEKGDHNSGKTQSAPEPKPAATADGQLSIMTRAILNDRGRFKTLRGYSVGDFRELADTVHKELQTYGPMQVSRTKIGVPYAILNADSFSTYEKTKDTVKVGSSVTWRTEDRSLESTLYVGKPEILETIADLIGDDELVLQTFKRLGSTYGKDLGILLLSSVVGGALGSIAKVGKLATVARFTGKVVKTGGSFYGAGDLLRNLYNECIPNGVATLVVVPRAAGYTAQQVNDYCSLIDKLEHCATTA